MKKSSEEIRSGYKDRLILPENSDKSDIIFLTSCGLKVASGYERVVIGDRGPYIEFCDDMIIKESIHIPIEKKWRLKNDVCFYIEWRTNDDCYVKLYKQKHTVNYADYKIGLWYVSPFDLTSDKYQELIKKLEK